MTHDINQSVTEVLAQQRRKSNALAILLHEQREKKNHLFAISSSARGTSSRSGTSSYVTAMSLAWIAENVRFARDLPLFKNEFDSESGKIIAGKNGISAIHHRQLDWQRQLPMALYLACQRNHKFPTILVMSDQRWIYDLENSCWSADGHALRDSLSATPLEREGLYCDLDLDQTHFYALDGQHRLMAIIGLRAFLTEGILPFKNVDGGIRHKPPITREMLLDEVKRRISPTPQELDYYLQDLMLERMGIEIIPAVLAGETYDEARLRLCRIFVDVNENLQSSVGDKWISLDKDKDEGQFQKPILNTAEPQLIDDDLAYDNVKLSI